MIMVPGIGVECVCLSGAMLAKAGTVLDVVWLGGIDCGRGECVSFWFFSSSCLEDMCFVATQWVSIPTQLPLPGARTHAATMCSQNATGGESVSSFLSSAFFDPPAARLRPAHHNSRCRSINLTSLTTGGNYNTNDTNVV